MQPAQPHAARWGIPPGSAACLFGCPARRRVWPACVAGWEVSAGARRSQSTSPAPALLQASPARAVSSLESPLQAAADPQEPQQPQRQLAVVAPATHSVVALAAAWDQLAPRLPLEMGMGQGAELILNALKLALASSSSGGAHPHDTLPPAARALGAGLRLADLASGGLPLDAEAIAAGVLADVLAHHHHLGGGNSGGAAGDATAGGPGLGAGRGLTHSLLLIEHRVGAGVAHLVHDVLRVRALPSRVDLYDDEAAAALRELCLSFYDPRATAVEVACRLEGLGALAACAAAPRYECQVRMQWGTPHDLVVDRERCMFAGGPPSRVVLAPCWFSRCAVRAPCWFSRRAVAA